MIELGIFSNVFGNDSFEQAIRKIRHHGFSHIQFDFGSIGLEELPETITIQDVDKVKKIVDQYEVSISAVSGTFNTLDQEPERLKENIRRFNQLVNVTRELGSSIVTICTGSFDPISMWRNHPDNTSDRAWEQLRTSLLPMVESAEKNDITLAFEPEQANVIKDATSAKELIDSIGSTKLKVLFDAANLINQQNAHQMEKKIEEALQLLHDQIAYAHCKDVFATSDGVTFKPIGAGNLSFSHYLQSLSKYYDGPIAIHGISESEVEQAMQTLQKFI